MKFALTLISLFLLAHSSFAQSKQALTTLYGSYLKGHVFAEEGDFRSALRQLQKAKKLDSSSVYIRLKIANLFIRLGEIEAAEKELKAAKKIDTETFDASLALIFLYSYSQQEQKLEAEYEDFLERAHTLKPDDTTISSYLAQLYFYKNMPQEAIKIYERLLQAHPEYLDGLFWLGFLYEESGRRMEAIQLWERGLEVDPGHAPILNSLGYIYAEEGVNLDQAELMVKTAVAKEPENGAYLDSLGWIYYKRGNYQLAEEYLKKALVYIKDPAVFEHLGDLYIALSRAEEAMAYYTEGLKHFPHNMNLKSKVEQYGQKSE